MGIVFQASSKLVESTDFHLIMDVFPNNGVVDRGLDLDEHTITRAAVRAVDIGTLLECSNEFIRKNGPCSNIQVSVFHANVRTKS